MLGVPFGLDVWRRTATLVAIVDLDDRLSRSLVTRLRLRRRPDRGDASLASRHAPTVHRRPAVAVARRCPWGGSAGGSGVHDPRNVMAPTRVVQALQST